MDQNPIFQLLQSLRPFSYLLALLAVGLLPVKKRPAYVVVSLLMGLLWAVFAQAARSADPPNYALPGWIGLALVEAGLFVITIPWFKPEARKGPWALAGALLIGYSVLVFPALSLWWGKSFAHSVFELPFPLIPFTCGVLFFTIQRGADVLLVPPLLWALLGGPDTFSERPELIGMMAALLSGAVFLLLPPELRGGGDPRFAGVEAYRTAYRQRASFGYALWALILGTGASWFDKTVAGPLPQRLPLNLTLLCGLGLVLWMIFPAWFSLWYRNVAWWIARVGGQLWLALRDFWPWAILLAGALALFWPLCQGWRSSQSSPGYWHLVVEWQSPFWIFLAAVLGWLLHLTYQGRKQLVIGEFTIHATDKTIEKWAGGLGVRLENELGKIASVYRVIDEASPSQRAVEIDMSPVEVIPVVEEVGNILAEASTIAVGSTTVKISLKPLIALLGRLVGGPRLTGSLHKVGTKLILLAELSGGGYVGNWRVDANELDEEDRKAPEESLVDKLVQQLAFRITAALVSVGSPRWQAVRCFTDGLRAFREGQRQNGDTSRQLRAAERCLIKALKDDRLFTKCHYNLGVVYRRLQETGSAEAAFRRALQEDPESCEAAYALAETLVHAERYREGLWFCEAAICIDPTDPRAWDLSAYARRRMEQENQNNHKCKVALHPDHSVWKEVRERSEIAVALAWRFLCRRAWTMQPEELSEERANAFLCTRNLGVVLTRARSRYNESLQVFHQAARLAPHDPDLRLYQGRTLLWGGKSKEAVAVLRGVFDDGLLSLEDRGLLWSTLAQAEAQAGPQESCTDPIRLARNRFLDLAAGSKEDELHELLEFSLEKPPEEMRR